jgi:hypothetical protein
MTDKSPDNKVQLGCGTLIVISIIVALFSGSSDARRIKGDLEEVNQRLERLEQKLDALTERLGRDTAVPRLP